MLALDGSALEGGGQIVRSAVALSAITGTPIEISNIRAGRQHPGLRYQHCAAIRAVAAVCGADMEGCEVGETRLLFHPGKVENREVTIHIGTAGSIPLVLQAWVPVVLECGGTIQAAGGTEVPMSPTIDYFENVYARALRLLGTDIRTEIRERGYYPKGGGCVTVTVKQSRPRPLSLGPTSAAPGRGIISCSSNLAGHVATRQAASAQAVLKEEGVEELPVDFDRRRGPGTGSSITAWAGFKGACALGKRGLPAEKVGRSAATSLVNEIRSAGEADQFLADQLLLYLARYGGRYTTSQYTLHARTMVWVLEKFGYVIDVRDDQPVELINAGCS